MLATLSPLTANWFPGAMSERRSWSQLYQLPSALCSLEAMPGNSEGGMSYTPD